MCEDINLVLVQTVVLTEGRCIKAALLHTYGIKLPSGAASGVSKQHYYTHTE